MVMDKCGDVKVESCDTLKFDDNQTAKIECGKYYQKNREGSKKPYVSCISKGRVCGMKSNFPWRKKECDIRKILDEVCNINMENFPEKMSQILELDKKPLWLTDPDILDKCLEKDLGVPFRYKSSGNRGFGKYKEDSGERPLGFEHFIDQYDQKFPLKERGKHIKEKQDWIDDYDGSGAEIKIQREKKEKEEEEKLQQENNDRELQKNKKNIDQKMKELKKTTMEALLNLNTKMGIMVKENIKNQIKGLRILSTGLRILSTEISSVMWSVPVMYGHPDELYTDLNNKKKELLKKIEPEKENLENILQKLKEDEEKQKKVAEKNRPNSMTIEDIKNEINQKNYELVSLNKNISYLATPGNDINYGQLAYQDKEKRRIIKEIGILNQLMIKRNTGGNSKKRKRKIKRRKRKVTHKDKKRRVTNQMSKKKHKANKRKKSRKNRR